MTSIKIVKEAGLTSFYKNGRLLLSTVFSTTEALDNTFCIVFGCKK